MVIHTTYRNHTKHGLGYIKGMSPVVVNNVTIISSYCQQPSAQGLQQKE